MKTETSKATHTTGPWHIQDNTADPCGQLRVDSAAFGAVAVCYTMEKGESRAPAEYVQNACLMSAAPELLEALRDAESFMSGFEGDELQEPYISKSLAAIRAAIAKATGGGQ